MDKNILIDEQIDPKKIKLICYDSVEHTYMSLTRKEIEFIQEIFKKIDEVYGTELKNELF